MTRTPKQIAADKLAELIERLEKAEGPNYRLEIDIFKLFNPEYAEYVEGRGGLVHVNDGEDQRVLSNVRAPNFTASLDAAVALAERVLPGWRWGVTQGKHPRRRFPRECLARRATVSSLPGYVRLPQISPPRPLPCDPQGRPRPHAPPRP